MQIAHVLFRITCHYCRSLLLEANHIRDTELTCLKEHVRGTHPSKSLPDNAGVIETLGHYDVQLARSE